MPKFLRAACEPGRPGQPGKVSPRDVGRHPRRVAEHVAEQHGPTGGVVDHPAQHRSAGACPGSEPGEQALRPAEPRRAPEADRRERRHRRRHSATAELEPDPAAHGAADQVRTLDVVGREPAGQPVGDSPAGRAGRRRPAARRRSQAGRSRSPRGARPGGRGSARSSCQRLPMPCTSTIGSPLPRRWTLINAFLLIGGRPAAARCRARAGRPTSAVQWCTNSSREVWRAPSLQARNSAKIADREADDRPRLRRVPQRLGLFGHQLGQHRQHELRHRGLRPWPQRLVGGRLPEEHPADPGVVLDHADGGVERRKECRRRRRRSRWPRRPPRGSARGSARRPRRRRRPAARHGR